MDGYVGVNRLVALERMGLPPLAGLWLPMMHSAVYSLAHYPFRYLTGRVGLEVCEDLHRSHCALHVNEAVSIDPATPSEITNLATKIHQRHTLHRLYTLGTGRNPG